MPFGDVPYFAMEYVEGRPLTDDVPRDGVSLRERLELFVHVCDAVHHAHQKRVIHHDLNSANIFVGLGRPKVLDLVVARATNADLQPTSAHTVMGQVIGTIPYASPEQVSGDPDCVDTRSDVYALTSANSR
jgi:serine/threonine protein kinase